MTLQWIPAWLTQTPLMLAMLFVWLTASYFWIRLAKIPTVVAIAVAPAVTGSIIWLLSIIYWKMGWFWSGARVLPVLVLLGLLGASIYVAVTRKWGPIPVGQTFAYRFATNVTQAPKLWTFALATFVGWTLAVTPTVLMSAPDNPVQQWDPTFHMNGVWGMTKLGVAAPGEGLAHNYDGTPKGEYPIGWHAFVSLFATAKMTVTTANVSSLAIMALWVVSMGMFVHTLYPKKTVVLATPIIAGIMPSMPADALTMYSQWPGALSVAYLPGIALLAINVGRALQRKLVGTDTSVTWGSVTGATLILLIAVWGGVQAHPVVAFNMLILLGPALFAGLLVLWRHAWRQQKLSILLGIPTVLATCIVVVTAVLLTPEVESMRNYRRYGIGVPVAFSQVLAPLPPFPATTGMTITAGILTVLAVAGSTHIVIARNSQPKSHTKMVTTQGMVSTNPVVWPIWSYLLFLTLVFFAYGPNWQIRKWIVGPWFSDGRRIMEPMSIVLVTLAAVGFHWLIILGVRFWGEHGPQSSRQTGVVAGILGVLLLVGTGFGGMGGRLCAAQTVLDPDNLGKPGMATRGVLDMMRTLPDILDPDAIVLGDPQAGAMYSQMLGQRWAYFPQLAFYNNREQQEVLIQRFKFIRTDPQVCKVIKETGITHYFENADGDYYGKIRSQRAPGLYNVDTDIGFKLVAEGDQGRLYEITVCD